MSAFDTLQNAYREMLASVQISVPKDTVLGTVASEALEMCQAYAMDSKTFAGRGDLVNAMASCAYGGGWLDAGITYGLVETEQSSLWEQPEPHTVARPMEAIVATYAKETEPFPGHLIPHLMEKTERYERMLSAAILAVSPAPDHETTPFVFAETATAMAKKAFQSGSEGRSRKYPAALAWYSYGYGWLDLAVRAGVLRVTGDRSLFTI